ncbi:MAG: hypothetical protein Q9214_002746 [Letrouitia sp. 1 TL-2023]
MDMAPQSDQPNLESRNIYIVGAQCTGKTTLVTALERYFQDGADNRKPSFSKPTVIREVARTVLQQHNFTADDITNSRSRALQLQKLILNAQLDAESAVKGAWFISDRSGLDPIVYARQYVGEEAAAELIQTSTWKTLEEQMRHSLIIVCEPGADWLIDDGVRLMPDNIQAWNNFHHLFCACLDSLDLPYAVLPKNTRDLHQRTDFVIRRMQGREAWEDGTFSPEQR